MSDVIALLLDDDLPPERLGAMLQAARKRAGMKRRRVASLTGISRDDLRDYERGAKAVPAEVCVRLAECYGDDLTAHVPTRLPVQVEDKWIVAGTEALAHPSGTADEVLRNYVDVLVKLRGAKAGEPIALRAADLAALASALGDDAETIELKIVDLLGCSRAEAEQLHKEMMRRKLIVPVAGLAAGIAMLATASAGAQQSIPTTKIVTTTVAPETSPAEPNWELVDPQVPNPPVESTETADAPAPTPAPAPAPAPAAPATPPPAPVPQTETLPAPMTDATVPPELVEDDVPISLLPGETFVEIGEAIDEP